MGLLGMNGKSKKTIRKNKEREQNIPGPPEGRPVHRVNNELGPNVLSVTILFTR
jgi:hypothetical protein